MLKRISVPDGYNREYLITLTDNCDVSFSRRELWIEITEYANNRGYHTTYSFATVELLESGLASIMEALNSL